MPFNFNVLKKAVNIGITQLKKNHKENNGKAIPLLYGHLMISILHQPPHDIHPLKP